uniref:Uncharacterized protein n=1 Tax=Anguilla anguilla TaxID=7936 RepID=A0A0E9RKH6_ANGAN
MKCLLPSQVSASFSCGLCEKKCLFETTCFRR